MPRDPVIALMKLQHKQRLELMDKAVKVEKIRRRRDILMSLAQASATNPMLTNAIIGLTGAAIGTASQVGRHTLNAAADKYPNMRKLRVPVTALEVAGDGLATLAGIKSLADTIATISQGLPIPGTSRATSNSIAFDIPDSEGAVILPGQADALPFRRLPPSRNR